MKLTISLVFFGLVLVSVSASEAINWSKVTLQATKPILRNTSYNEINGRITNGNMARPQQFPYQVGLLIYQQIGVEWCGGTIISNRWIITAAHCIDGLTTGLDVYLGAWNNEDHNEKGQQIIFVAKRYVIKHENWRPKLLKNNLALIKLPVAIAFNDYIQPAKLPKLSETYSTYAGENAITTGWGRISDDAVNRTNILRWIEVPVITNFECELWFSRLISSAHVCAKTIGGTSPCNGDSGGPLVLADGSNTLIGATSFEFISGCQKGWPAVFTRITSYFDWIEKHTGLVNK